MILALLPLTKQPQNALRISAGREADSIHGWCALPQWRAMLIVLCLPASNTGRSNNLVGKTQTDFATQNTIASL